MSGAKWTVVGGAKKQTKSPQTNSAKDASSKKIGGLQESTGAFVLYSSLNGEDGERGTERESLGKTSKRSTGSTTAAPEKRKPAVRKTRIQTQKYNFDEFARQLDPNTLTHLTKEAHKRYPNQPQHVLKEVTGQVQLLFGDVEVEREYAFSNRMPGYPLTTLSTKCLKPLLSVIKNCPPLTQEAIFRYCVDQLLTEVKAGIPSYGTRIILQLLVQSNPSACSECTQKIKILLQSSLSKVPEALSLLWAGLPHPKLHPVTALEAWPELCLPLLYSTPNVPRQVLNYAVDYTCVLLGTLGTGDEHDLSSKLPPTTLCALLASPTLNAKRAQTNVQEMIQQLQVALLGSCTDRQAGEYFSAVFKRLAEDKLPQAALTFTVTCLATSVSSVRSWSKLFPSLPSASQLLLKELASHEQLSPDLPLAELSQTLELIVTKGSPEEKTLAQGLLTRHGKVFETSKRQRLVPAVGGGSSWCSVCGVITLLFSVGYLVLLSLFIAHLAKNGPAQVAEEIHRYVPLDKTVLRQLTGGLWSVLTAAMDLGLQFKNSVTELITRFLL